MTGRPGRDEAAPYYFTYIDRIPSEDVVAALEGQMDETLALLRGIPEDRSLHRYAPGKWSVRQVLSHVNDNERVLAFRALWFARGFEDPLPGFDEKVAADAAAADDVAWSDHVEEFRAVRLGSVCLFRNVPPEGWTRRGVANGKPVTVRALAYIIAGHAAHHTAVLRERYL